MSATNYVHLENCTVKRLTDKAALIEFDGDDHWIPKSQMAEGEADKLSVGDCLTLTITEWIAEQNGIEIE